MPVQGYERIAHYFQGLSDIQERQIQQLYPHYNIWNARINLISRKDFKNFYIHHVLHALSIAKLMPFAAGTKILDIGTGGGFPGIPLAILFPEVHFTLIDSIEKKVHVVQDIKDILALHNVTVQRIRAEQITQSFDMAIGRSVASVPRFVSWACAKKKNTAIAYLTGGQIEPEVQSIGRAYRIIDIHTLFREPYFRTKKLVYFP